MIVHRQNHRVFIGNLTMYHGVGKRVKCCTKLHLTVHVRTNSGAAEDKKQPKTTFNCESFHLKKLERDCFKIILNVLVLPLTFGLHTKVIKRLQIFQYYVRKSLKYW